jgi:hypothetical protein
MENDLATRYRAFYERDFFYDPSKKPNDDEWNDARTEIVRMYKWIHLLVHTQTLDNNKLKIRTPFPSFETLYNRDREFRSFVNVILSNFSTIGRALLLLIRHSHSRPSGATIPSVPFTDITPLGIIRLMYHLRQNETPASDLVAPLGDLNTQLLNMVILGDNMMKKLTMGTITFEDALSHLRSRSSKTILKIYNVLSNTLTVADTVVPLLRIDSLSQIGRTLLMLKDNAVRKVMQSVRNLFVDQAKFVSDIVQMRSNKKLQRVRAVSRKLIQARKENNNPDLVRELEEQLQLARKEVVETQRDLDSIIEKMNLQTQQNDRLQQKMRALESAPSMESIRDLSERLKNAEENALNLAMSTQPLMKENDELIQQIKGIKKQLHECNSKQTERQRELEGELTTLRGQIANRVASAPPAEPLPGPLARVVSGASSSEPLTVDTALRFLTSTGGSSSDFVSKLRSAFESNSTFVDTVRSALPIRPVSVGEENPCNSPDGFQANLGTCHREYLTLVGQQSDFVKTREDLNETKQLLQANVDVVIKNNLTPIRVIESYDFLKSKIESLQYRMLDPELNASEHYSLGTEIGILMDRLHVTKEYQDEVERENRQWLADNRQTIENALAVMKTFAPPEPEKLKNSKQSLLKAYNSLPGGGDGKYAALAERIFDLKPLLKINKGISPNTSEADLMNNFDVSKFDPIETLAIFANFPPQFTPPSSAKKARYKKWFDQVRSLISQNKKNHIHAYKGLTRGPFVEGYQFDSNELIDTTLTPSGGQGSFQSADDGLTAQELAVRSVQEELKKLKQLREDPSHREQIERVTGKISDTLNKEAQGGKLQTTITHTIQAPQSNKRITMTPVGNEPGTIEGRTQMQGAAASGQTPAPDDNPAASGQTPAPEINGNIEGAAPPRGAAPLGLLSAIRAKNGKIGGAAAPADNQVVPTSETPAPERNVKIEGAATPPTGGTPATVVPPPTKCRKG